MKFIAILAAGKNIQDNQDLGEVRMMNRETGSLNNNKLIMAHLKSVQPSLGKNHHSVGNNEAWRSEQMLHRVARKQKISLMQSTGLKNMKLEARSLSLHLTKVVENVPLNLCSLAQLKHLMQ